MYKYDTCVAGDALPPILIDASALLAVSLDEPERAALIAATQHCTIVAPQSLPFEVGNALVALHRKRRLTAEQVAKAWGAYVAVPVRLVDVDIAVALATAERRGQYAYGAYMLEAARPVADLGQGSRARRPRGGRLTRGGGAMKDYTLSEARQQLASVLDQARRDGAVRIRRRDGQVFVLRPAPVTEGPSRSPLDVPPVRTRATTADILAAVRVGREQVRGLRPAKRPRQAAPLNRTRRPAWLHRGGLPSRAGSQPQARRGFEQGVRRQGARLQLKAVAFERYNAQRGHRTHRTR